MKIKNPVSYIQSAPSLLNRRQRGKTFVGSNNPKGYMQRDGSVNRSQCSIQDTQSKPKVISPFELSTNFNMSNMQPKTATYSVLEMLKEKIRGIKALIDDSSISQVKID